MKNKVEKLTSSWSLPNRAEERTQVSLRMDYITHAKLHALKSAFPNRSVNEIINDLLISCLDEVIDGLGEPSRGGPEIVEDDRTGEKFEVLTDDNAACVFNDKFSELMRSVKTEETK